MVGRIGDRTTFEALRRSRHRGRHGPVGVTYVAAGDDSGLRVAYAIGRRVGGAVVRNRVRRRLRAAVAAEADRIPPGAYLVSGEPAIAGIPFEELRMSVLAAMTQAAARKPSR